ncbi:MAG TPA: rhodanese-like domain-containing protein [Opitutaceae bacterium]
MKRLVVFVVAGFAVGLFLWLAPRTCEGKAGLDWPEVQARIERRFPDIRQIDTAELAAWLADGARVQPVFIDARARQEFEVSHLPGAMHAEGTDEVLRLLRGVPEDRPVVVYCSVGWRSAVVTDAVRQRGKANIWNLRGSIFQWANEGRPLEREGAPTHVVHPYDREWGVLLSRELWSKDFPR